ncbi:MAG: phosphoesterase PA-phosphatase related [Actinomycetia bacterium]|nr:phosphoesterase PA-phosphatase related [Actinomycetes bacterium]
MSQPRESHESLLAGRGTGPRSLRRPVISVVVGYATMVLVLLGVGYLLTHTFNDSIGRWDEHVNEWFARHRTAAWNDVTKVATWSLNTVPVIVMAALVAGVLALRKRFREAVFLVLALVIEITTFLPVTFVVARPRPDVPRMNATPSTSSFPSGHTAAATVLFVGVALIVGCCTSRRFLRVAAGVLAALISALVGFARVYRGLHHPTDVFVGVLFGLGCLAIAAIAVRALAPKSSSGATHPADTRGERVRRDAAAAALPGASATDDDRIRTIA